MKKTNNIPASLVEGLQNITRAKSGKAMCKGCIYALATIVIAVLMFTLDIDKGGWIEMLLGCVGVIALIMTFVSLFGSKPQLKVNGVKLDGYEIYFRNPSIVEVTRMIEAKNAEGLRQAMNDSDNGLRLNAVVAEDGSICRYRMYKYEPFEYKPEGDIIEMDSETARFIAEL